MCRFNTVVLSYAVHGLFRREDWSAVDKALAELSDKVCGSFLQICLCLCR